MEQSKIEYAKRKIQFANPEVAMVKTMSICEPEEIEIKEENNSVEQKESDILTHQKLGKDQFIVDFLE